MQEAKLPRRKPTLRRLPFRLLCLLFAALCLPPAARPDIQQPARGRTRGQREQQALARRFNPPPAPVPATVRMEPGGRAEIVLRADGAPGHTVEFLLRTPPVHGGFEGEGRRLDRDRVALTYLHRAADGPGRDRFTFAAQAPGTAVSAAGTVDIEIIDAAPPAPPASSDAPDLAATPADLDFGAVEAGRSTGITLTLENRGGGLASGRLDPPAPWSVEGDGTYQLGRGERRAFRLVFRPAREGSFARTLGVEVQGGDRTAGCVVRLVGTGLAGVAAHPAAPLAPATDEPPAPALVAVSSAPPPVDAAPPPTPTAERPSAPPDLPTVADPGAFAVNEAAVAAVEVRAAGATTLELAWKPPAPLPAAYRVERRSFARDDTDPDGVRIDWNLCDRVDLRVHTTAVAATVRGLAPGEPVTLRVVSVDTAGRLAPPSPEVNAATLPGATWWRPTPLKGLLLALAVCLALIVRRRWQERQLVRELDARHEAPDGPPLFNAREN